MKKFVFMLVAVFSASMAEAAWTFTEVNVPGSSGDPDILDSGIAWRPQGDYAILVCNTFLYRYDGDTGALITGLSGSNMQRIAWSNDGSYALITGGTNIYRYDHAAVWPGTLTQIAAGDIQGSGTYTISFFDIVFNPANDSDPPYISTNRQLSTANKQLILYRYDPAASPKVYWDLSGGQSAVANSGFMAFAPVSMAFESHGDYIVIANRYGINSQGFYIYDPDQSTFPMSGGLMQYFNCSNGNSNTVLMNPNPIYMGNQFVLEKGNGIVDRYIQQSLPASFVESDPGFGWYTSVTTAGDSSYSSDGGIAIFLERQTWSPNHIFMTFDGNGAALSMVDVLGITNRTIRLYAVAWRPGHNTGLMAGADKWIIKFSTDEISTPTAIPSSTPTATETPLATQTPTITETPVATETPTLTPIPADTSTPAPTNTAAFSPTQGPTFTPAPVPAVSNTGIALLLLTTGLFIALARKK